jgi:hypothetical protein
MAVVGVIVEMVLVAVRVDRMVVHTWELHKLEA